MGAVLLFITSAGRFVRAERMKAHRNAKDYPVGIGIGIEMTFFVSKNHLIPFDADTDTDSDSENIQIIFIRN